MQTSFIPTANTRRARLYLGWRRWSEMAGSGLVTAGVIRITTMRVKSPSRTKGIKMVWKIKTTIRRMVSSVKQGRE